MRNVCQSHDWHPYLSATFKKNKFYIQLILNWSVWHRQDVTDRYTENKCWDTIHSRHRLVGGKVSCMTFNWPLCFAVAGNHTGSNRLQYRALHHCCGERIATATESRKIPKEKPQDALHHGLGPSHCHSHRHPHCHQELAIVKSRSRDFF